ncbi:hypothetical protein GGI21_002592 [Coemansia aciculifera]|nr:hypothetical protein GGI21_002592 [Coemansia aciculifera]
MKWAGDTISASDNASQVVVAIADAMTALSAAHKKCSIVHGNISDRAILFHMTAGRVTGALAEFDYAAYANDSARAARRDLPELTIFQSIHSLESAEAPRLPLDDWESLLYLIIFLGTYGINDEQRREFFCELPKDPDLNVIPDIAIEDWVAGNMYKNARLKRRSVDSRASFDEDILSQMPNGPLRDLAEAIHQVLYLHPECTGAMAQTQALERARKAFYLVNSPDAEFIPPREIIDRLVLCEDFMREIRADNHAGEEQQVVPGKVPEVLAAAATPPDTTASADTSTSAPASSAALAMADKRAAAMLAAAFTSVATVEPVSAEKNLVGDVVMDGVESLATDTADKLPIIAQTSVAAEKNPVSDVVMETVELLTADVIMADEEPSAEDIVMGFDMMHATSANVRISELLYPDTGGNAIDPQALSLLGETHTCPLPNLSHIDFDALWKGIQKASP